MDTYKPDLTPEELLKIIFDYIGKIARQKDVDQLLLLLADMGRDIISADRCTVWLLDRKHGTLWSKVAHGLDRISIPSEHGIVGYVVRTGEALIINDPYNDSRFDKEVDRKTGYKTRNIISLPIQNSRGENFGVFQAVNKLSGSGSFTNQDMEYLLLAASYTGKELEAALLQEEIEQTQREIIFTLAETGEMRSKETGNHVKRVAEYSRVLADAIGLDPMEAELLKYASPLHDIGKIAIPDAILLKPGKLDDEERKIMETHSHLGYEMLKHSERRILKTAAVIAAQHHEKWDGTGYPARLSAEGIHIFGRITAVADVFDALACDRVYKKAWDMDRITTLFLEEKGHHFDPDLIDAFMANLDRLIHIRDTFRDNIA